MFYLLRQNYSKHGVSNSKHLPLFLTAVFTNRDMRERIKNPHKSEFYTAITRPTLIDYLHINVFHCYDC